MMKLLIYVKVTFGSKEKEKGKRKKKKEIKRNIFYSFNIFGKHYSLLSLSVYLYLSIQMKEKEKGKSFYTYDFHLSLIKETSY